MPKEGQENIDSKLIKRDEIKAASSYQEALDLYMRFQNQQGADSILQYAIAEVASRFGNTEVATQFVLLAGQTKNVEDLRDIAQFQRGTSVGLDNSIGEFSNSVKVFRSQAEDFSDRFGRSIANLASQAELISHAGSKLNESATEIKVAANSFSNAASQLRH